MPQANRSVVLPSVDDLAQIIRRVDGDNSLGAGALAEAILSALSPLAPAEGRQEETQYLIRKSGAWYRPNSAGYTNNIAEAGRYTLTEAEAITHPNGPDGPRDNMSYEPAPALVPKPAEGGPDLRRMIADALYGEGTHKPSPDDTLEDLVCALISVATTALAQATRANIAQVSPAEGGRPVDRLLDRMQWCQPLENGKQAPRRFIVRFEDADRGDAVFDDEAEAREFFARANTNWNCYLFGTLEAHPAPKPAEGEAVPVAASGWVLVPREPTEAMTQAGSDRHFGVMAVDDPDYDEPDEFAVIWRAMLAAAPISPAAVTEGGIEPVERERWRANLQAHVAAQRMVREAIEELFGPVASLESEDATLLRGPEPHHTAEAFIAALQRVKSALANHEARGDGVRVTDDLKTRIFRQRRRILKRLTDAAEKQDARWPLHDTDRDELTAINQLLADIEKAALPPLGDGRAEIVEECARVADAEAARLRTGIAGIISSVGGGTADTIAARIRSLSNHGGGLS